MTKLLLNHDPLSRESVYFSFNDHDNKVTITHEQDVSEHLKLAHADATDGQLTKDGMRNDMWKYAHVPNSVIVEMKIKHGVDFFDRNDASKVFDLLNTEYSRFKTTDKVHKVRKR